jgi:hypothetical protein
MTQNEKLSLIQQVIGNGNDYGEAKKLKEDFYKGLLDAVFTICIFKGDKNEQQ